jgi:hypothetical protein
MGTVQAEGGFKRNEQDADIEKRIKRIHDPVESWPESLSQYGTLVYTHV